ncbi:MAG: IS200/IS605 family element transposase accessory protein TnpB [Hormoscilla sp. SP5CHS1]|nr:IS200/IS605 family element transposase accessory protein TnpB [Hormoscilla sp. SP12CHS1]MBC6451776.1 IS200/IS605 family element transposase accessory protein TnpB [Hormoscilla sp. SP5CHS1]
MGSATYQTRLPDNLIPFGVAMGNLMSEVERSLYVDLQSGEALKDLKRRYQVEFGINARQFNSVHAVLKGKIKSRKECHKRQIKELKQRITGLKKKIKSLTKGIKKAPKACPIKRKGYTVKQWLKFQQHLKKRHLVTCESRLKKLQETEPTIIFGGRKLWNAQFNLEANGYANHSEWLKDWQQHRNSQSFYLGSKDETAGCQIFQLDTEGNIKIRVPKALEGAFGQYVTASGINFNWGQDDVIAALNKDGGQALSYRIAQKNDKWYLFVTTDRPEVPFISSRRNGAIGVDLNPGVVGWAYCDAEGNLVDIGQFKVNLQDQTSAQTEAILGDLVKHIVQRAETWGCPIVVETLDFSKKKATMKEQGTRYSRMLSNFAYSKFDQMLLSQCDRFGVQLMHRNPAYSSTIGMVKFMSMYGLSSDTAAALAIARRGLGLKERIPSRNALGGQVDTYKHVWSHWNALRKGLPFRRHDLFTSRVANSEPVVKLSVDPSPEL